MLFNGTLVSRLLKCDTQLFCAETQLLTIYNVAVNPIMKAIRDMRLYFIFNNVKNLGMFSTLELLHY